MTKPEFDQLLLELLQRKFQITMVLDNGAIWYDLNTGMKSHLHIALIDGECKWRGRYDTAGVISDINSLRVVGMGCLCGRDYASEAWWDFLKET